MDKSEKTLKDQQKKNIIVILWILVPSAAIIIALLSISALLFGLDEEGITATCFLLFAVGAIIAGIGALVGGGAPESRLVGRGFYNPHSAREIMIVDERIKQRGQQLNFALILGSIGILVIISAIALFWGFVPFFS
ncbi:MAG: hypothetical protein ACFFB3_00115 [Candidatus Hodarchaeota archaeon]